MPAQLLGRVLQAMNKGRLGCLRPCLAGKWAAFRSRDVIRRRRREIQASAHSDEALIGTRIEKAWWKLHISSRFKGGAKEESGE